MTDAMLLIIGSGVSFLFLGGCYLALEQDGSRPLSSARRRSPRTAVLVEDGTKVQPQPLAVSYVSASADSVAR